MRNAPSPLRDYTLELKERFDGNHLIEESNQICVFDYQFLERLDAWRKIWSFLTEGTLWLNVDISKDNIIKNVFLEENSENTLLFGDTLKLLPRFLITQSKHYFESPWWRTNNQWPSINHIRHECWFNTGSNTNSLGTNFGGTRKGRSSPALGS